MNITIWNNTLRNYPDVKDWIMRNAFFEMKAFLIIQSLTSG